MEPKKIKMIVKNSYGHLAAAPGSNCNCSCSNSQDIARNIGYSNDEIGSAPDANLGLGCGNPTAFGHIKNGDIVLDLGCGAGFDVFLAAKKTGNGGKVIGIDITEEMIDKAKKNAKKYNYANVEFILGDIENLPLENNTIDIVISNCVINLAPDKLKVFAETCRVLKSGGKMFISDIVLLDNLTEEQMNDEALIAGCVGGAVLKNDYIKMMNISGFKTKILNENKSISKQQYQGLPLESLLVEAIKIAES